MLNNIQVGERMEHATTIHGTETAPNLLTTGAKSRLYTVLAFVALLGGCSVGPRYKAPTTPIGPFHNPTPTRADASRAPPLDTWWKGFGDSELAHRSARPRSKPRSCGIRNAR